MKRNNQDLLTAGNQTLGIKGFGGCSLSQYQQYLLKLLSETDRICRKNNIRYFLMYGSLIGAVRHHGFVPWDDDADIIMTRQEFNRFRECCKTELGEEFDLVTCDDDDEYNYTFPKLRLKNTTYIIRSEISRHGRNAGFFIDIILMDYVPRNRFLAMIQKRTAVALHRLVSPGFFQSRIGLNPVESALVAVSRLVLGKKNCIRIAEKILSCADPEKSDYLLAEIFLPSVEYFYVYDRYHFDNSESVPFENITLQVPVDPISLLQKCYFRKFIENNILLEEKYENEAEAVRSGKCYKCNDIMFIPEERSRDRHLEVVFDCNHNSSFFDSYYYSEFNKKENDKCAVRERKQREKIRKTLKTMESNDNTARAACRNVMALEYISGVIAECPNARELSLEKSMEVVDALLTLKSTYFEGLSREQAYYILQIMIRTGNTFSAKRMALHLRSDYPDAALENELDIISLQMDTFYAVFENNSNAMSEYLRRDFNDFLSLVLKGILEYHNSSFEEAEGIFRDCLKINDSTFWADYYLGLIEMNVKGSGRNARRRFAEALNDTTFMPLLQLALDKIKEIDNELSKTTVDC